MTLVYVLEDARSRRRQVLAGFWQRSRIAIMPRFGCFRFHALLIGAGLVFGLTSTASANVSILDDGSVGGPAKILVHSAIHRGDGAALDRALDQVMSTTKGRINRGRSRS